MAFLKEFIIFNILKTYYMCRTEENCSIFWRNSSYLACYKITTCVEQEETVLLLEEFIIFNILQNYYMCRTR